MKIFGCKLEITIEDDDRLISREYENLLIFEDSLEKAKIKLYDILRKMKKNPKDIRKYKVCNDLAEIDYILGQNFYYK